MHLTLVLLTAIIILRKRLNVYKDCIVLYEDSPNSSSARKPLCLDIKTHPKDLSSGCVPSFLCKLSVYLQNYIQRIIIHLLPFRVPSMLTACNTGAKQRHAYSRFGYALDLLVTVSSTCYHASTSALSTSSSSRGLTNFILLSKLNKHALWDISS